MRLATQVLGDHVAFSSSDPSQQIGPVNDHGDGIYSATITSSTTPDRVTITATDTSASPSAFAQATLIQTTAYPPANLSPPTIAGVARQGQTLAETHGRWTQKPTTYSYQWQDCDGVGMSCMSITGAAGPTHRLTAHDVGHTAAWRN
jgi:hypothetical protein